MPRKRLEHVFDQVGVLVAGRKQRNATQGDNVMNKPVSILITVGTVG